jgi:rubrerythrin
MFENLAKDEKEHLNKIKELHQRLKEQGRWPEDVPLEVKGTRIQEVFESAAMSSVGSGKTNMDDIEAVRIAMEFEERGAVFYAELATKCDDPKEREFFMFLSSMEHHHLMSLRDTMAYFEDPEGWFVSKERHTLDGA